MEQNIKGLLSNYKPRLDKKETISLEETSQYCHKVLSSEQSMDKVLNTLCQYLTRAFGNYLSPGNLSFFEEMEINFVELLDQIIYEYRENLTYDQTIKEYIIADLYSRLSLHVEAFNDPTLYKKNLPHRQLYPDDLAIIRDMKMEDMVPFLIEEWEEMTNLQKSSMKTLLYFAIGNFHTFKNIYEKTYSNYIKAAAILGMKYDIENAPIGYNELKLINSDYMRNFKLKEVFENPLPESPGEKVFTILHIERAISMMPDDKSYLWILKVLSQLPEKEFKSSWLPEIYNSMSNIFLNLQNEQIIKLVSKKEHILDFIKLVDFLPRNIFNRITGKIDELGRKFHLQIASELEDKKLNIHKTNSNIFNYICRNSKRII